MALLKGGLIDRVSIPKGPPNPNSQCSEVLRIITVSHMSGSLSSGPFYRVFFLKRVPHYFWEAKSRALILENYPCACLQLTLDMDEMECRIALRFSCCVSCFGFGVSVCLAAFGFAVSVRRGLRT